MPVCGFRNRSCLQKMRLAGQIKDAGLPSRGKFKIRMVRFELFRILRNLRRAIVGAMSICSDRDGVTLWVRIRKFQGERDRRRVGGSGAQNQSQGAQEYRIAA